MKIAVAALSPRLEDITQEHIRGLVDAAAREDQQIDFKLSVPDLDGKNGPKAKRDLLCDVAAFANGAGGDIVMGIEEGRDTEGKPNGIAVGVPGLKIDNLDAVERRWMQIVEAGLDPKLSPKTRSKVINVGGDRVVVVLRVPRSVAAPHMVKEHGWFHVRRGPQNLALSTGELRAAFELSEGWADRVRRFRDERLARIVANETPTQLDGSDRLVLHIVPLTSALERMTVDLSKLKTAEPLEAHSSYGPRFNVDGVAIVPDEQDGRSHSYVQFFRDGALEVTTQAALQTRPGEFYASRFERDALEALTRYLPILQGVEVGRPLAVLISLVGLRGLHPIDPSPFARPKERRAADRDLYTLPDLVLHDDDTDVAASLRPVFDTMWQCFGFERSPNYAGGRWSLPNR